ncbi:MAG: immunity 17 family protein [Bacteroidaceae bacterium]
MWPHYFILTLFAGAGVLTLTAAIANWDWFFLSRNAQTYTRMLGRRRARLVYGLFGIAMLAVALWLLTITPAQM